MVLRIENKKPPAAIHSMPFQMTGRPDALRRVCRLAKSKRWIKDRRIVTVYVLCASYLVACMTRLDLFDGIEPVGMRECE
jgi:hypothetical protein